MIKKLTFNAANVTSNDDSVLYKALGAGDRILKGCEITHGIDEIYIADGYISCYGRQLKVEGNETVEVPAAVVATPYSLVLEIDMDNDIQAFKAITSEPVQDDISGGNGMYQMLIATFTMGIDGIEAFIDRTTRGDLTNYTSYMHNSILRCQDITKYVEDGTLWDRIAGENGFKPFEDIFVGDYIHMSRPISAYERTGQYQETGSDYVTIAGCDALYGIGDDSPVKYHHLVMVAGKGEGGTQHFGRSRMNSSDTTAGGYVGSEMHTATLGAVTSSGSTGSQATINQQLYAEFGSHLKTTRELLTNSINATGYNRYGSNSGCSNNWGWASCQAVLMSEVEVYGSVVWSSSGFDTGTAKNQLPLFKLSTQALNNRSGYYWLKDVVSASFFAHSHSRGNAGYDSARYESFYVRPRFVLAK